jgi:hypothetical protein
MLEFGFQILAYVQAGSLIHRLHDSRQGFAETKNERKFS